MNAEVVEPTKRKLSPILIIVLVIVGLCLLGCLIAACVVFILPLLGITGLSVMSPAINNTFSEISTQIALTATP
jgi:hypothetical protein